MDIDLNIVNENEGGRVNDDRWEQENELLCKELEEKLSIGKLVESLDQAYLLYCEYARLRGFSVRKGDQTYYHASNVVRGKEFKCSCEGFHDDKRSKHTMPAYKRQNTRTDCKARIRFAKESKAADCWVVQKFEKLHNHELVPIHQSYMLRSVRHMSHAQQSLVEALKSAGIGVSRACRFFEKQSGGPNNVDFTRKDVYNHLSTQNLKTNVPNVDATALVQFFITQSAQEPFFYWNTQLDDDGRLMNFFFRDSRCLIDYEHFGDVLSIDTTYKTNRYDLICAPFVGVNHHMRNVLFGLAFLSNESTSSFQWLFETFLESMHAKEPIVVYSDQSASLIRGIDSTFRTARHRLCQWHINRNAPSHFGALNVNAEFKRQWHYCMNGVDDEAEFEQCWNAMINQYSLGEHRWFVAMYKLRRRWASVFTNDCFSAGLLATSRSEATNRVLKDLCSASSTIMSFVQQFMQIIMDWHERESADDFGNVGCTGSMDNNSLILSQASRTLTRNVYKVFQNEVARLISVSIIERPVDANDVELEYKVSSQHARTKIRRVVVDAQSHMARCTCRMWETTGVICRHIFRIFLDMNVMSLPHFYLLPRWSKLAKQRHPNVCGIYRNSCGEGVVDHMTFVNYVLILAYSLTEVAKNNAPRRKMVVSGIVNLKTDVIGGVPNNSARRFNDEHDVVGSTPSKDAMEHTVGTVAIRDPPRNRRANPGEKPPMSHWQKKKTKTTKNPSRRKWPDIECSQQTVSNFDESSISFISQSESFNNTNGNDVGDAVWDAYTSLSQRSADESLDEPIDISSIFDVAFQKSCPTDHSNVTPLGGGQRYFI